MTRVNDFQKKRVVELEGYTPSQSVKGLCTVQVLGIDGCVTAFENMDTNQVYLLWKSFDASESVVSYTITWF